MWDVSVQLGPRNSNSNSNVTVTVNVIVTVIVIVTVPRRVRRRRGAGGIFLALGKNSAPACWDAGGGAVSACGKPVFHSRVSCFAQFYFVLPDSKTFLRFPPPAGAGTHKQGQNSLAVPPPQKHERTNGVKTLLLFRPRRSGNTQTGTKCSCCPRPRRSGNTQTGSKCSCRSAPAEAGIHNKRIGTLISLQPVRQLADQL